MVDEPEPLTSLPQGTTTNLCIKTFQCDFFFFWIETSAFVPLQRINITGLISLKKFLFYGYLLRYWQSG